VPLRPPREITPAQALLWLLALVGSTTAFSWACLLFFADREQRALTFALCGLALVLWTAVHVTDRRHERR